MKVAKQNQKFVTKLLLVGGVFLINGTIVVQAAAKSPKPVESPVFCTSPSSAEFEKRSYMSLPELKISSVVDATTKSPTSLQGPLSCRSITSFGGPLSCRSITSLKSPSSADFSRKSYDLLPKLKDEIRTFLVLKSDTLSPERRAILARIMEVITAEGELLNSKILPTTDSTVKSIADSKYFRSIFFYLTSANSYFKEVQKIVPIQEGFSDSDLKALDESLKSKEALLELNFEDLESSRQSSQQIQPTEEHC